MTTPLHTAQRIVMKLGSSLVAEGGAVRAAWMAAFAAELAEYRARGAEVILVSSGAVALGRPLLGLGNAALSLEEKQAAAAAGQPLLMQAWQAALAPQALAPAQVLLTLGDSEHRRRYLNARATFATLLAHGLIPIVNENDTVATAELKFGDNDRLAARVAVMVGADALVLFSDIDGLYTQNPRTHADAQHLPRVDEITPEIEAMAGGAASTLSNGGMKTKIDAAKMAVASGCHMVIARGEALAPLAALEAGGRATWFMAQLKPQLARKQWIASSVHVPGSVTLDAGAVRALRDGKSLLPAGVTAVSGQFERGEVIAVLDASGTRIAHGISNYSAAEAAKIRGKKTDAIEAILGYAHRDTLIHRDDLAMFS